MIPRLSPDARPRQPHGAEPEPPHREIPDRERPARRGGKIVGLHVAVPCDGVHQILLPERTARIAPTATSPPAPTTSRARGLRRGAPSATVRISTYGDRRPRCGCTRIAGDRWPCVCADELRRRSDMHVKGLVAVAVLATFTAGCATS